MADIDQGSDHPEISHMMEVVIVGKVDLYEYDDMDRGDPTDEAVASWKRLAEDDIRDSLSPALDSVTSVEFRPVEQ